MKPVRVALFSYNGLKYSETFIHALRAVPGCDMHYLYGGELPVYHGNNTPFVQTTGFPALMSAVKKWLGKTIHRQHLDAVEKYLLQNKIQVVYANYSITAFPIMEICQRNNIALVVHFHGWTAYRGSLLEQYKNEYIKLFQVATSIVHVSQDMGRQLLQLGAPACKLKYVVYGVNTELFAYTNHSQKPACYLSVGRFCDTKNPHLTILAFSRVLNEIPEAKLVMVGGEETMLSACFTLCKALKIEHAVSFKGVLTHQQVAEEMRKAYAFVQHSATTIEGEKEGTPNSIMEAMASGLPVIATRHAGIKDIITEEETGLLCDEYDVTQMAANMVRVWKDKELATRLSKQASAYAHSHLTRKIYLQKVSEVIANAVFKQ